MNSKDTTKERHIAVIGAGLAGAVFARRMLIQGHKVTVFDKSRGTGGRHAGCRMGNNSADLGAPFFDAVSPEFRKWLSLQSELIGWQPQITDFAGHKLNTKTMYTATPRQSALTRALLQGATLITSTRIGYIWPETQGVIVRDESGNAVGHFDQVVVATPAPQAAPLLEAVPRYAERAAAVQTLPAWMLVVTLNTPVGLNAGLLEGDHPVLARAIKDSAKPGRNCAQRAEIWTIEANSDWSREHQDATSEAVAEHLLAAFQDLLSAPLDVEEHRAHRWLYARQQSDTDRTYLWREESSIGVCGDWLHGQGSEKIADSESAWRSGNALADHILARQEAKLDI